MIEYDLRFHGDINWEKARKKFQDFLHRKLNIDTSSVVIQGIISDTVTWYIMEGTPMLVEALNNMLNQSRNNMTQESKPDQTKLALVIAAMVTVVLITFLKLRS